MTANQLRYWELRWKQYYEYYYLQEQKRSNAAKEQETARHNRAQERIAKQELVLKRIELSQNQEKILQQWESLKITAQANYVKAALELRDQDRKAREFLESQKMATVSMIVQYNNEQQKRQTERFSAYVEALDKGWDKAAVAKVLEEIDSDSTEINEALNLAAKQYNLDIEVKGPKGISGKLADLTKQGSDSFKEKAEIYEQKTGSKPNGVVADSFKYTPKEVLEKWDPTASKTKNVTDGKTHSSVVWVRGDSNTKGPGVSMPSEATKIEGGKSAVIYSPGVKIASTSTLN